MKAEKTFSKLKDRPSYMSILIGHKDKKVVKVLTGVRRCGKSAMLSLFSEKLLDLGVSDRQIVRMNFESLKFDDINNYKALYTSVEKQIVKNKKTYLLFDEIQLVEKWEKAVDSFLVDFDVDIYMTGSNAYILSSELSTLLSGRYVEIKVLPLSFKEFLDFNTFDGHKWDEPVWNKSYWTMPIEDKFNIYLKYGGMPSLTEYKFNEQRIHEILEGIYSTVIVKDVMQRNNISNQSLLQRLIKYLAQNVGSINSTNNISNYLRNEKTIEGNKKHSNKTIENYITALENAFIFYEGKRHDIKGKEIFKTNTKNYI
ncbi:MAG: ATP-binding protein [Endomicrobium sp.]|jgi:predicted AAA+ superfamily ATPase|nr:ATP-binding protein [Endomicrobium sp.]